MSPDRTKVVLGGAFTKLNGSSNPGYGLAMVNATTGASLPMPVNSLIRNGGKNAAIMNLTLRGRVLRDRLCVRPDGGNLEGAFKADWSGKLIWLEDCHGDTYSLAVAGPTVYIAGHPHDCAQVGGFPDTKDPTVYHRALAFTAASTGTLTRENGIYYDFGGQPAPTMLHWFPDLNAGSYTGQSQGPWSVAASGDYVVYGGEFTVVNGKSQQGLVRFALTSVAPNKDGPRLSGSAMGLR